MPRGFYINSLTTVVKKPLFIINLGKSKVILYIDLHLRNSQLLKTPRGGCNFRMESMLLGAGAGEEEPTVPESVLKNLVLKVITFRFPHIYSYAQSVCILFAIVFHCIVVYRR